MSYSRSFENWISTAIAEFINNAAACINICCYVHIIMFYSSVHESFPPQNTISRLELPCTRLPLGLFIHLICHGWPRVVFDAPLVCGWPDIKCSTTLHATQWECSEIIYTSFCHQLKLRSYSLTSVSPFLFLLLPPPLLLLPLLLLWPPATHAAAAVSAAPNAHSFCSCCFCFCRNCWQASQPLFAAAWRPAPTLSWTYDR